VFGFGLLAQAPRPRAAVAIATTAKILTNFMMIVSPPFFASCEVRIKPAYPTLQAISAGIFLREMGIESQAFGSCLENRKNFHLKSPQNYMASASKKHESSSLAAKLCSLLSHEAAYTQNKNCSDNRAGFPQACNAGENDSSGSSCCSPEFFALG